MPEMELRYAGVSYFDKTRALERGEVSPEGCRLDYVRFDHVGELFRIMAQDPTSFSASEKTVVRRKQLQPLPSPMSPDVAWTEVNAPSAASLGNSEGGR